MTDTETQTYVELARDRMIHAETQRKHMALPFQVLDGAILSASVNDFGNFYVAHLDRGDEGLTEQDRETLEFIALACNSHYDLVDILKDCARLSLWRDAMPCALNDRIDAAIAKATP